MTVGDWDKSVARQWAQDKSRTWCPFPLMELSDGRLVFFGVLIFTNVQNLRLVIAKDFYLLSLMRETYASSACDCLQTVWWKLLVPLPRRYGARTLRLRLVDKVVSSLRKPKIIWCIVRIKDCARHQPYTGFKLSLNANSSDVEVVKPIIFVIGPFGQLEWVLYPMALSFQFCCTCHGGGSM